MSETNPGNLGSSNGINTTRVQRNPPLKQPKPTNVEIDITPKHLPSGGQKWKLAGDPSAATRFTCSFDCEITLVVASTGSQRLSILGVNGATPAIFEVDQQCNDSEPIGITLTSGSVKYSGNGQPPIRSIRITAGRPMRTGQSLTLTRTIDARVETLELSRDSATDMEFIASGPTSPILLHPGERAKYDIGSKSVTIEPIVVANPLDRQ
jgi:hypothetical protein